MDFFIFSIKSKCPTWEFHIFFQHVPCSKKGKYENISKKLNYGFPEKVIIHPGEIAYNKNAFNKNEYNDKLKTNKYRFIWIRSISLELIHNQI